VYLFMETYVGFFNGIIQVSFVSEEELNECGKAVAAVIEQRAHLDWEIMAWYENGGVRDFSTGRYPTDIGMELVCAPLTSLV